MNNKPIDILLIEDNPGDVRLVQEAFKEGEIVHNLRILTDGEDALRFLRKEGEFKDEHTPSIVLLDVHLPKKNGIEILKEIKEDPKLCSIPIIVITASSDEDDLMNIYKYHANSCIQKPLDPKQFIDVIKAIEVFWLNTSNIRGNPNSL